MPDEPRWLTADDLIEINRREIEAFHQIHGLRSRDLLESAAARPRNIYAYGEEDVLNLAASLMVGVIRNHAFIDGNKRTGVSGAFAFLELNGFPQIMRDHGELADAANMVATGDLSEPVVADILGAFIGAGMQED